MVQRQVEEEEEEDTLQTKLSSTAEPLIQRQTEDEEEETLQAKGQGTTETIATDTIQRTLHSLKGSGQRLPTSVRSFFEPRFGVDFSHVRVHTDSTAARLSRQLNAEAFTYGRDIYFGEGRYNPSTASGKRLLAHELTHVMQQRKRENKIYRWSTAEHKEIGDKAYKPYIKKIKNFITNKKFSLKGVELTYGDIVTLADFYKSPEDIDKKSLQRLTPLLYIEYKETTSNISVEPSGNIRQMIYNIVTEGRYIKLALNNLDHFTYPYGEETPHPYNLETWSNIHKKAIEHSRMALKFMHQKKHGKAIEEFNKSLSLNAFGDHYLSDAFAAGHLLTPRGRLTPGRSKDMHDWYNKHGVDVENELRERWRAYGDGRLNFSGNKENKERVINSIKFSIEDIFRIFYETGAPAFYSRKVAPTKAIIKSPYIPPYLTSLDVLVILKNTPVLGGLLKGIADLIGETKIDNFIRDFIKKVDTNQIATLSQGIRAQLIRELLKGPTLDEDEQAILKILRASNNAGDIAQVIDNTYVGLRWLLDDLHGKEYDELLVILKRKYFKEMPLDRKLKWILWASRGITPEWQEELIIAILEAANDKSSTEFKRIVYIVGKKQLCSDLTGKEEDRFEELLKQHGESGCPWYL